MAMPNKKGWLAVLFIFSCLAIPFVLTYYVSTSTFKERYAQWRGPIPQVTPQEIARTKSRIMDDRVMLPRDERVKVHNTSLVYKGMDKDQVVLELYLEELDPEYPYIQRFSKQSNDRILRLGDVAYTMKSVSQSTLVLVIHQIMGAN